MFLLHKNELLFLILMTIVCVSNLDVVLGTWTWLLVLVYALNWCPTDQLVFIGLKYLPEPVVVSIVTASIVNW